MNTPYHYLSPISDPADFFNRSSEITRITSRIAADRPQSVSIVGGPYMGKTSIINYLCHPDIQSQYLDKPDEYILLQIDLKKSAPTTPESFFSTVSATLKECTGDAMEATFDGFNNQVKKLMQTRHKIVLFMDDFGLVTQHNGFPLEFFSFMRSVANSNDVGYVTTSPVQLQKLCHTQDIGESPFFNIFTTVTLEPFKTKAARRLVEDPAQRTGRPLSDFTDWILELGGSSPYLLQLTAHFVYAAGANGIDRKTLEERVNKEARPFLEEMWNTHCSDTEREVLRQVYSDNPIERRYQFAAEALERRGYLQRRGEGYALDSQLISRFVQHQSDTSLWKRLLGR